MDRYGRRSGVRLELGVARRRRDLRLRRRGRDLRARLRRGLGQGHEPRSVRSPLKSGVGDAPPACWTDHVSWAGPSPDELAALDRLGTKGTWELGGRELRLTN